jgi:integrase
LTRLVDDLAAEDFENLRRHIAKRWGPVRLGNEVQRVRSVFKYGFEAGLMDRPARFGPGFKKPSRKVLRLARASKGSKMFDAGQLRTILDAADLTMRAMVFLGVNCGFGPADVANLPLTAVDLKAGWVEFPRPKTGVPRRCPLWNETIVAVRTALDRRPDARDAADAGLVFITKYGKRWAKADVETDPETGKVTMSLNQPVTEQFSKLLRKLKLNRPGLGFYALRHTFETIGGDSRDQVAVDALMGHIRDDMASLYREKIEDARLESVTRHVHGWLFPVVRKRKAK